ncbi:MAG: DUF1800 domain-containing protein [Sphingobacteriales bacterium]|nr:DUF1800 domain-containing protein [Sphingobacteriales bacterium]
MVAEADKIKHLYYRAGFGVASANWGETKDISSVREALFHPGSEYKHLQAITTEEVAAAKAQIKAAPKADVKDLKQLLKQNLFELNNRWLNEMIHSEAQLQEKMALFWHGHFACRSVNPYYDQLYLDVIRKNALGDFRTLLSEVSRSPAMLQFLNNQQNKKGHPNENFAREVMELFTLGRGNYTEQDIKEAARAFTGWGFDQEGQFKFRVHHHDFGVKNFQGKTGDFSGEDILKIILEKKECAFFITKKIYRFLVNDEIDVSIVQSLSEKFYQSGYNITSLLKEIFSSAWFYDPRNIGVKIKSPVELLTGMLRIIPADFTDTQSTLFIQRSLGQVLLNPPNVSGWQGGKNWIDSSSLLFRMRLAQIIYFDKEIDFTPKEETPEMGIPKWKMADEFIKKIASGKLSATSDWTKMVNYFASSSNKIQDMAKVLLARPANAAALSAVSLTADTSSGENEIKSIAIQIMSLPDFQLC